MTDALAQLEALGAGDGTIDQKMKIVADIEKKTKDQVVGLYKTISDKSDSLQSARTDILAQYTVVKTAEKITKEAARMEKVTKQEHTQYNKQYKEDTGDIKATYQAALESFMNSDIMPMYDIFVQSATILPPSTFLELVNGGNKYSNREEFMKLIVDDSPHRNSLHRFIRTYFEVQIRALTIIAH